MDKINNLLQQVSIIQRKYDEIAKITGENFNIFSVMNMEHSEVNTHSSIIGELLNSNGSHGQGSIFLDLFVEQIKQNFNSDKDKIELEHFDKLVNDKICERTITIENNWDDVTGGRIDLIIEDNKQIIIIENKIYAIDQPYQLIRYQNYAKTKSYKKAFLFYLTLDGKDLKEQEEPYIQNNVEIIGSNFKYDKKNEYENFKKDNIHHCLYYPISFEIHIRDWIEKCLEKTHSLPIIRETLVQYLHLIKKLTNQTTNDKMSEEIKKIILSSDENIKGAIGIFRIFHQTICEEFINRIETKLGVISQNYNQKIIGEADSGKWFSKKGGVLLWFRNNYKNLELSIENKKWTWEENRVDINGHFDNKNWEEILEEDNINGIADKIKLLIERFDLLETE